MHRDVLVLAVGAFLRTAGVGLTGALLLMALSASGYAAGDGLLVVTAGLLGSACALALVLRFADRFGRRRSLALVGLSTSLGGLALAAAPGLPLLALGAFLGLVNGMGRDRGPALALEQAILPSAAVDAQRTRLFARYHVVLDLGHGAGALLALLPAALLALGAGEAQALRLTLGVIVPLGLTSAWLATRLSPAVELAEAPGAGHADAAARRAARPVIRRLAALFALDSLGGGFLPNTLLALWLFERHGLGPSEVGVLLALGRAANALSYLAAARIAARIGLVRTMVFTHVPSSLLLLALPLVPSAPWAVALYLARELLVEMDLPTRQSYTMAVVPPAARTAAAGATGLARALGWAAGAWIAARVVPHLGLAAPLMLGAGVKLAYDGLLFAAMRRVRPPEERDRR